MSILDQVKNYLDEAFSFSELSDEEKELLFSNFEDSYIKKTGSAMPKWRFNNRAYNWSFYGDVEGGVAAREQKKFGGYKLVAAYGSPKNVVLGFREMINEIGDQPIWGMLDKQLADKIQKLTNGQFKSPPILVLKALSKFIMDGKYQANINKDGSFNIDMGEGIGKVDKYFVANSAYYKKFMEQFANNLNITGPIKSTILFAINKLI